MKITEALAAEHAVLRALFDHIEGVLPRLHEVADIQMFGQLLEHLLHSHGKSEDDLVFPALDHVLEDSGQRAHFLEEHREIDHRLSLVQRADDVTEARRLLRAVVRAARKHFDHEERKAFPLAEQALSERALTELGEVWLRNRKGKTGATRRAT